MPLFAGVRAEPVPDDAPAAAMHQAMVMREMRGSAHLAAISAARADDADGARHQTADDVELFGWKETRRSSPTRTGPATSQAEPMTNDMLGSVFAVLDDAGMAALVAGTDAMHAALKGSRRDASALELVTT